MSNIILEQYSTVKREIIKQSPFFCLHNKKIEKNAHQINAFLKAISSINTGGMILADEVGLGKTIEAGLVLKYLIRTGKKKIMIATPASLRVQWQEELREKFDIKSEVLDGYCLKDPDRRRYLVNHLTNANEVNVIIASYRFASRFMMHKQLQNVKWDMVVIDEAHNMRNVFKGTKTAKKLYDASYKIPKLLLTATPLQNSLEDLYGLVSFIDPRIFESPKVFNKRYINEQRYDELKHELMPILNRTLRRDVATELKFAKRTCIRMDFKLSDKEKELYVLVDRYVKNASFGFPNQNKNLCILVIRKLLASSSFALVETFSKVKNRLEILLEDTHSSNVDATLDSFFDLLDSENQEEWIDEEDEVVLINRQRIQSEIDQVNNIINIASSIKFNTKMSKLLEGIKIILQQQENAGLQQKIVVFTESLRTQQYIFESLMEDGYLEDDIVLFNGNYNDPHSKQIFNAWRALHPYDTNLPSVQYKYAMVDYFKNHGKIFVSTDSGAEGLNLQFSNSIINYDLPWNPQRIEQRIGRVHRYGQKHDVIAMNFLNTENIADRRVYEILSKKFKLFEGVFGASDEALGLLSNEINFEKRILEIYQTCGSSTEFVKQFDSLDKKIDAKKSSGGKFLKNILSVTSEAEKIREFKIAKRQLLKFYKELEYWHSYTKMNIEPLMNEFYEMTYNPFDKLGLNHGYLFIGGLVYQNNFIDSEIIVTDNRGNIITVHEHEMLPIFETISNNDIKKYKMSYSELEMLKKVYLDVEGAASYQYQKKYQIIIEYNNSKIDNWVQNKIELLNIEIREQQELIENKKEEAKLIPNFNERIDFLKSVKGMETRLVNLQESYMENISKIEEEARKEKLKFSKQYEIEPIFLLRILVKF